MMDRSRILSSGRGHATSPPDTAASMDVQTGRLSKPASERRFLPGLTLLVGGLMLGLAGQAQAATITYSGTFNTDDQLAVINLTIAQTSQVTFETDSYGGGVRWAEALWRRVALFPF